MNAIYVVIRKRTPINFDEENSTTSTQNVIKTAFSAPPKRARLVKLKRKTAKGLTHLALSEILYATSHTKKKLGSKLYHNQYTVGERAQASAFGKLISARHVACNRMVVRGRPTIHTTIEQTACTPCDEREGGKGGK